MKNAELALVIPVYNEEKDLTEKITELLSFLYTAQLPSWHVIIADNGSTDGTCACGTQLCEKYQDVSLIHVECKGVGLALRQAWQASTASYVACMDLDLSTNLRHMEEACALLTSGEADLVNGSRLLPASHVVGRSLLREITSRAFNTILQCALGVHFTDGMCGFQFMRREVFSACMQHGLANEGWFFSAELLVRAEWAGVRIQELAITWIDDTSSKVHVLPLACYYLREIMKLRRERRVRGK